MPIRELPPHLVESVDLSTTGKSSAMETYRAARTAAAREAWEEVGLSDVPMPSARTGDGGMRRGARVRHASYGEGEVIEADPPRKLVHTWTFNWDEIRDEGPTRVTFEIADAPGGVSKLTVTHELENAPMTAAQLAGEIEGAGGGWPFVLSDLKTLLETGESLPG